MSSTEEHAEYPRALALSDSLWAVSSGSGEVYVLQVSAPGAPFSGQFVARYDLGSPCLLHAARADGTSFRLLLTRAVVQEGGGKFAPRTAAFELLEVAIDAAHTNDVDAGEPLAPAWVLAGGDVPLWAAWAGDSWAVLCEEPFGARAPERAETDAERAEREHKEKKAKLGLGAQLPTAEQTPAETPAETPADTPPPADSAMDVDAPAPEQDDEAKQYPFHWTQDQTSVTITIPLPAGTPRSAISVAFTPSSAAVSVRAPNLTPALFAFLSAGAHTFWSEVAASTWTYEADEGRLCLELEKQAGDVRWPSVFIPDDSDEDDVPETFSPDQLAAIRASFGQVQARADDEVPETHPSIPALLREQLDFDEDDEFAERTDGAFSDLAAGGVGRSVLFGAVADGQAAWSRQPAAVLSLPLLTAGPELGPGQGVIVRHAVDGLLIAPAEGRWVHRGTNPALAFVMSSKRDLRLVRHVTRPRPTDEGLEGKDERQEGKDEGQDEGKEGREDSLVLAFDAGSGTGQGNVYLYYPPQEGADTARQGVLAVSGGDRGALLGVGLLAVGEKRAAVALCERSLVVLDLGL